MDLSKLSDKDLEAIASGDMSKVSDEGLRTIVVSGQMKAIRKPIDEMLAQAERKPEVSPGGVARQLGLTTRAAISGLTALPTMIADPITGLMNVVAGRQVAAPPSETIQNLLNKILPQPQTAQERVSQDLASALVGTGGAVQLAKNVERVAKSPVTREVAATLARDPRAQGIATLGGAGASSLAREEGLPPIAQAGLGIVGSMTPSGAPAVARSGAQIARSVVQPFTQEGREVMVGNVLNRFATIPESAAARAMAAPEYIPGSMPTLAEAARDPGLLGLQTPVAKILDVQNLLGQRVAQQNLARSQAFQAESGVGPEVIKSLEKIRKQTTKPMREEAFFAQKEFGPMSYDALNPVRSAMNNIVRGETGGSKPVRDAMKFVQGLIKDVEEVPVTPERIYGIRKDINQAIEGKFDKEDFRLRLAAQELGQIRSVIDDVIEQSAPGFKNYLSEYRRQSVPISQKQLLQKIEEKSTVAARDITSAENAIPIFSQAKLRSQLTNRAQEIGRTLNQSQATMLDNLIKDLDRTSSLTSAVAQRPGSDTFKNFSTANLIGSMFSDVLADTATVKSLAMPLNFLYKIPDERVGQLLVEAMLDPKLASLMMQKASKMTVEPVSKALRKKAEDLGFAPLISGMQAE